MSKLKQKLMEDLKTAMKEKDNTKKGVINLIRAGIQNFEIENKRELTEEEEIKIVQREMKQTNQSLEEALKVNREDIVKSERTKILIIEDYLPKQLTVNELLEIIISLGIDKNASIGHAIGLVMKEVAGRADGKIVSQIVREYLKDKEM